MGNRVRDSYFHRIYMILLVMLGLVEFVRGAFFIALIPVYLPEQLGATVLFSGAIISAQYGADTIFKPVAGWLVDYFGPRRTLIMSLPLALFGLSVFLWSKSLALLMGGSVLFGLGTSPVWPAVISTLIKYSPESARARTLSSVYVAWLLGLGTGMVLVNFCYQLGPKLLISVLPGIFCMPLVLAFYIHRSRQRTSRQYSINGQLVSICRGLWDVRILIPGAFAQTLALSMLLPVLFPYLKAHYGLTQSAYGMLTILGGAVAVLLMVPVGKMVDRWGYRFLLTAGFGLAGIAILVIIHYQYHLLIYPYAVLLGIAYALILPSWNGLIAQLLPEAVRASLYSVMMSIEGLGVAIGPVLGGKLGITYGSRVLFSTSALILIVMACFYFMLHKPVADSHVDNL